MNAKQAFA